MSNELSHKQWQLSHLIFGLILSLVLFQWWQIITAKDTLTFLDVGQGDAILIQSQEGRNVLIDTGPDGKVVEQLSKHLPFFNQNIDLFILTHPDLDHYGGAIEVLQKYPVKAIMLTGVHSSSQIYNAFVNEFKAQKVPIIYPTKNSDIQIGQNVYLDLLYPFENQSLLGLEVKSKNDTSISLMVKNKKGENLALLTGDAEEKQEIELLLSAQDFESNLFKLGHHGSKTSSTANFLKAIGAESFVNSAGKDNKFGHPHPEVLERIKEKPLKRTDHDGDITFMLK